MSDGLRRSARKKAQAQKSAWDSAGNFTSPDPGEVNQDQGRARCDVGDPARGEQDRAQDVPGQPAPDAQAVDPERPAAQEAQGIPARPDLGRAMADLGNGDRGSKAPSFNGEDYHAWVFRWEHLAVGEDLWDFYDGTALRPEPPVGADVAARVALQPEQARWDKANQKAFAMLVKALQPDELVKLIREFGARTVAGAPAGTPRMPA